MSILVTGIGFVGAYIVRDLLDGGHDVVVYGLFGERPGQSEAFPDIENAKDILGEEAWRRVRVVVGDIRDRDQLSRTVDEHGVTGIVHLAAMVAAASERDIPRAVEVKSRSYRPGSPMRLTTNLTTSSPVPRPRERDATLLWQSPPTPKELTPCLCS